MWLRYARLFIPTILHAFEIAQQISNSKRVQRKFMKNWAERTIEIMGVVMEEMQDNIDDDEVDTTDILPA